MVEKIPVSISVYSSSPSSQSLSFDTSLSQVKPVHTFIHQFSKIRLILSSYLLLDLKRDSWKFRDGHFVCLYHRSHTEQQVIALNYAETSTDIIVVVR